MGVSRTGGLADVADEAAIKGLLPANNLLNAVGYMIPSYSNVDVSYINGGAVSADMAGGFGVISRAARSKTPKAALGRSITSLKSRAAVMPAASAAR